ncbi:hypothetical protein HK104_010030 [Borealophlyctis nickersoniae]|nr:hypothetical protein HK104_010030 [Borealophlyctis nickersoniae]
MSTRRGRKPQARRNESSAYVEVGLSPRPKNTEPTVTRRLRSSTLAASKNSTASKSANKSIPPGRQKAVPDDEEHGGQENDPREDKTKQKLERDEAVDSAIWEFDSGTVGKPSTSAGAKASKGKSLDDENPKGRRKGSGSVSGAKVIRKTASKKHATNSSSNNAGTEDVDAETNEHARGTGIGDVEDGLEVLNREDSGVSIGRNARARNRSGKAAQIRGAEKKIVKEQESTQEADVKGKEKIKKQESTDALQLREASGGSDDHVWPYDDHLPEEQPDNAEAGMEGPAGNLFGHPSGDADDDLWSEDEGLQQEEPDNAAATVEESTEKQVNRLGGGPDDDVWSEDEDLLQEQPKGAAARAEGSAEEQLVAGETSSETDENIDPAMPKAGLCQDLQSPAAHPVASSKGRVPFADITEQCVGGNEIDDETRSGQDDLPEPSLESEEHPIFQLSRSASTPAGNRNVPCTTPLTNIPRQRIASPKLSPFSNFAMGEDVLGQVSFSFSNDVVVEDDTLPADKSLTFGDDEGHPISNFTSINEKRRPQVQSLNSNHAKLGDQKIKTEQVKNVRTSPSDSDDPFGFAQAEKRLESRRRIKRLAFPRKQPSTVRTETRSPSPISISNDTGPTEEAQDDAQSDGNSSSSQLYPAGYVPSPPPVKEDTTSSDTDLGDAFRYRPGIDKKSPASKSTSMRKNAGSRWRPAKRDRESDDEEDGNWSGRKKKGSIAKKGRKGKRIKAEPDYVSTKDYREKAEAHKQLFEEIDAFELAEETV